MRSAVLQDGGYDAEDCLGQLSENVLCMASLRGAPHVFIHANCMGEFAEGAVILHLMLELRVEPQTRAAGARECVNVCCMSAYVLMLYRFAAPLYTVVELCGVVEPPSLDFRLVSPDGVRVGGTYSRPWELFNMESLEYSTWSATQALKAGADRQKTAVPAGCVC